jgi:hydroxypyruvate reductase
MLRAPTVIDNAEGLGTSALRRAMLEGITAGIAAARPQRALRDAIALDGSRLTVAEEGYDLDAYDDVLVLGGGNVAGQVASVLEDVFGRPLEGVVVSDTAASTEGLTVAPGDHPLPTERNVEATRRVLERADVVTDSTLVLCIVGGGASALLAAPAAGIPLEDLRETFDRLLKSGADVGAINTVRKHVSSIKGGRLAEALAPADVVGLVFSDVVGDDLATIASGPLWADETTYADALEVLETFDVEVPPSVRDHLEAGDRGERSETPSDASAFDHVETTLVANADTALAAARSAIESAGVEVSTVSTSVTGPAPEAGRRFVALPSGLDAPADSSGQSRVFLGAGETTVNVVEGGVGGPSQSFALSGAIDLASDPPTDEVVLASVDTDGIDGASDAAGAIVDATTVDDVDAAREALAASDAGTYLADRDAQIRTGPTGTNVNDLYLVGVAPR